MSCDVACTTLLFFFSIFRDQSPNNQSIKPWFFSIVCSRIPIRRSTQHLSVDFTGKKPRPGLEENLRDRYLVWTRFVSAGSGGIQIHNLLDDVRTSRLARLSVHITEPLTHWMTDDDIWTQKPPTITWLAIIIYHILALIDGIWLSWQLPSAWYISWYTTTNTYTMKGYMKWYKKKGIRILAPVLNSVLHDQSQLFKH